MRQKTAPARNPAGGHAAPLCASFAALCVSAASGGGGKTLLTLGLARAAARSGLAVKPFKKGPDYIDAAWLGAAAGRAATNLDPFFLPPHALRALYVRALRPLLTQAAPSGAGALALVEGNRGLYDGLDARGSCSTAALARTLDCPVLLCLNATKMTRTAAALLSGLLGFEPGLRFLGVVLNQVGSPRHETALRRAVEAALPLPVLGALPRLARNPLPERHMGLASSGDGLADKAHTVLEQLADLVQAHTDLGRILSDARHAAGTLPDAAPEAPEASEVPGASASSEVAGLSQRATPARRRSGGPRATRGRRPRIGYLRDAAFWFYYEENLDALRMAGAELTPLALLDSRTTTKKGQGRAGAGVTAPSSALDALDGLYLGGGFPEDFLPQLTASPLLPHLARLARLGLPVYAECGGLILLSRGMERDGHFWPLAGVLPVRVLWSARPQGLGYVEATVTRANPFFPTGLALRGHEFHYSRCVPDAGAEPERGPAHGPRDNAACAGGGWATALTLTRGTGLGFCPAGDASACDGLVRGKVWASYTHIFAPAVPCWAASFVDAARAFRAERARR